MESSNVIQHYDRDNLYGSILKGLQKQGVDIEILEPQDLWPVDQFHVGGAQSTLSLLQRFPLSAEDTVLDVGCGIGGPCRMIAHEFDCQVQGIDLTPTFVDTAAKLSKQVGLDHLTTFSVADALQLPFEDNRFDMIWTQHVQMNVANKRDFYGEINRVLKPGGRFIFHDLFQSTPNKLLYPVPWSEDDSQSFLFSFGELESMLIEWGFKRIHHSEQNEFAVEFFEKSVDLIKQTGNPPLGAQLVMGDNASLKLKNILQNFLNGHLELHEAVYVKK